MIRNPQNIDIVQGKDIDKESVKDELNPCSVYIAEDANQRYILGTDKEWYPFSQAESYFPGI